VLPVVLPIFALPGDLFLGLYQAPDTATAWSGYPGPQAPSADRVKLHLRWVLAVSAAALLWSVLLTCPHDGIVLLDLPG
jgi:hypothetical protein